jgi:hypothetical protein
MKVKALSWLLFCQEGLSKQVGRAWASGGARALKKRQSLSPEG